MAWRTSIRELLLNSIDIKINSMANSIYAKATVMHQFARLDFNSICLMSILQLCSSICVDMLASISLLNWFLIGWRWINWACFFYEHFADSPPSTMEGGHDIMSTTQGRGSEARRLPRWTPSPYGVIVGGQGREHATPPPPSMKAKQQPLQ
jgi:hypothetical protein